MAGLQLIRELWQGICVHGGMHTQTKYSYHEFHIYIFFLIFDKRLKVHRTLYACTRWRHSGLYFTAWVRIDCNTKWRCTNDVLVYNRPISCIAQFLMARFMPTCILKQLFGVSCITDRSVWWVCRVSWRLCQVCIQCKLRRGSNPPEWLGSTQRQ